MDAQQLQLYLSFLKLGDVEPRALVHGDLRERQRGTPAPAIPVRVSTLFQVRHASRSIAAAVTKLLNTSVVELHQNVIPAEAVVQALYADFQVSAASATVLYLLNPTISPVLVSESGGFGGGPLMRTPQYWYRHDGLNATFPVSPDTCVSSNWHSNVSRMAVYDLSAGPYTVMPLNMHGDGVVSDTTLPRVFSARGTLMPNLIPSLAAFALVRRIATHDVLGAVCTLLMLPVSDVSRTGI